MEKTLARKIYGQKKLIERLSYHYAHSPRKGKPKVFVITGPSGVGKTFSAHTFALETFQSSDYFLEIDGTEYVMPLSTSHDYHKLVGAPLGVMGAQKGQLTEWLKKTKGNGVLVINEADKMHPEVWTRLMELFDRGRITNGAGEVLEADKLYILLTSNRGATLMFPPAIATWSQDEIDQRVAALDSDTLRSYYGTSTGANDKQRLPPEVLKRVTEYLVATPISREVAVEIARAELTDFNQFMNANYSTTLVMDEDTIRYIALTGFTSGDDGRTLNRRMRAIAEKIIGMVSESWHLEDQVRLRAQLVQYPNEPAQFEVTWNNLRMLVPAPQATIQNPLRDPKVRQQILQLPIVLKKRVIGQDDALNSIVQVVTTQLSDANRRRPIALFVVGSTGTGKTEIGRGLAESLYGSPDRVTIISLGNITHEANFNKVFGSDPGYIGSDVTREFEQALINNPEGGVIVFDEASNMGGFDKGMKELLFKKFYEIFEEGRWVSPVTSKVYDLKKYIFLLTGNDGEKLIQGITADEMRMEIWRQNKSRENVRALLIDSGVPEAFINRMADVILMKPLTRPEMDAIVVKLIKERFTAFESQHEGLKLTYDDAFVSRLADSFFDSSRGGRSVRAIIDERLPNLVTYALLNSFDADQAMHGIELKFSLTDNLSPKTYARSFDPARKVQMMVKVIVDGVEFHEEEMDLTEQATEQLRLAPREALIVALHEAGHAVVNDPLITREELAYVSIRAGRAKKLYYLGYARTKPVGDHPVNPTRRSAVVRIGTLYAGKLAQELAGFEPDAGWTNDREQIIKLANEATLKWGTDPRLMSVRLNEDGEPMLTGADLIYFKEQAEELIREGEKFGRDMLTRRWPLVRSVAAELIRKGHITADRFKEITRAVEGDGPTRLCETLLVKSLRQPRLASMRPE